MIRNRLRLLAIGFPAILAVEACADTVPRERTDIDRAPASSDASSTPARPSLGVMSSLPVAWPILDDFETIASGKAATPWLGEVLRKRFDLVPLDNLVIAPGRALGDKEHDPLAGLESVAIIQPRGLSPADNVAIDDWVRAGGSLLLALDPELTGHYEVAFSDPRHPSVIALIPPVVKRWGLTIRFDEEQDDALRFAALGEQPLALHRHGEIAAVSGLASDCSIDSSGALASCSVGKGKVTLLADAAVFEHEELAGESGEAVSALLELAFGDA